MQTKTEIINGIEFEHLMFRDKWVFPTVMRYAHGIPGTISIMLVFWDGKEWDIYGDDLTKNLLDEPHDEGCSFINGDEYGDDFVLDWLEKHGFGKRTGRYAEKDGKRYPEFNFYAGEKFVEYRECTGNRYHDGRE